MGRIEPLWDKNSYQGVEIQKGGSSYLNESRIPSFVSEKPNSPIPTITVGPKDGKGEKLEMSSVTWAQGKVDSYRLWVESQGLFLPYLSGPVLCCFLCLRPRFGRC